MGEGEDAARADRTARSRTSSGSQAGRCTLHPSGLAWPGRIGTMPGVPWRGRAQTQGAQTQGAQTQGARAVRPLTWDSGTLDTCSSLNEYQASSPPPGPWGTRHIAV